MINDSGKDISDDIVQGALYPSCMACSNANKPCHWKMSIIHLRLRGLPNKARNCENCVRAKGPCQLIWDCDSDESLKRAADSALEPESSKRVKVDCPDLVTCLQSIDEKIGALVNLTAAQALRTTKEHEAK